MIKKYFVSGVVIIAFVFYVVFEKRSVQPHTPPTVPNTPAITPPAAPTGQYKDGTYIGKDTDAYYGNLKIKIIVKDGSISDVVFLAYPNDRQTSVQINSDAMPVLKSETIAAQNEKIDIVSGATQTSEAFIQSLGEILSQVKS